MKHRYHLPDSVEMVLAGISMGGYGAALIAAQTGKFSTIISIAGAYIAKDVEIGNTEVWGSLTPYSVDLKKTFLYYFLPLSDLEERWTEMHQQRYGCLKNAMKIRNLCLRAEQKTGFMKEIFLF